MKEQPINFEQAFERLQEILEKMNSGELSLDVSLAYYEEANALIGRCQLLLQNAEKKVEILLKNRNQELELDGDKNPLLQSFEPDHDKGLTRI